MTEMDSAIGIIGGADGPTVIFIAGDVTSLIVTAVVVAAAVTAAVVLGVMYLKRRRNKNQA